MAAGKVLQTSFIIHAVVYAIVIAGLWMINSETSSFNWVRYVAWGWGIGLVAHGTVFALFGRGKPSSR